MMRRFSIAILLLLALSACGVLAQPQSVPTSVPVAPTPTQVALVATPNVSTTLTREAPATPAPDLRVTKKPETPTTTPTPTTVRTFSLSAEQAQEVTVFMEFIRASNAGQFDVALALLDEKVVGSDCDYESVKALHFNGTSEAAEWLHQRIADHDQLEVSRILNENPDPVTGSHVIGVEYARRTSYTLAKLGFPKGIKPQLGAKVVFHTEPTRISVFANGPGGGDPNYCRPGI